MEERRGERRGGFFEGGTGGYGRRMDDSDGTDI